MHPTLEQLRTVEEHFSNGDLFVVYLSDKYRNELKASEHYRRHLLVCTLAAWRLFVVMMHRESEREQARQTTQNKMAAFLDAAASGRLWTDRTCKNAADEAEPPSANDRKVRDGPMVWFISHS